MQTNSTNAASSTLQSQTVAASCVRPEFLKKANPKTVLIQELTQFTLVCMYVCMYVRTYIYETSINNPFLNQIHREQSAVLSFRSSNLDQHTRSKACTSTKIHCDEQSTLHTRFISLNKEPISVREISPSAVLEGVLELQFYILRISVLDEGQYSSSCPGRFTARKTVPVSITQQAGESPNSAWAFRSKENNLPYTESIISAFSAQRVCSLLVLNLLATDFFFSNFSTPCI